LKGYLGERLVLYVALKGEEPFSVVVGVRAADTIFLIMVGVDVRGRESSVYFNSSYNEPIRDAIETGLRRIYCGKLAYEVKSRRGFQLVGLSMYLHVPNGLLAAVLKPMLACQSALLRSRMARLTTSRPVSA
jgi:predicted N-acyltransferase